jgi:hypothetical protein
MTKKHFIELANAIRFHNENAGGAIESASKFDSVQLETLADFFESVNPAFNRNRWLDYIAGNCGPNGGKSKN